MSNHGGASNYYRRMRRLACLCDQIVHSGQSLNEAVSDERQSLGRMLKRSAQSGCENYSDLLLLSCGEDQLGLPPARLEQLGDSLISCEVSDAELRDLKKLADLLHHESAFALARLRSR